MKDAEIVTETEKILNDIVAGGDCTVYDVEYVKEGPNRCLRVYIDKEGGVGLDDCETVSRALEKILDERDFIENAYVLEVSSPGVNRQLKKDADFIRYCGREVDVKLYAPVDGKKEYRGVLKRLTDGQLIIVLPDGSEKTFARGSAAAVRLAAI